MLAPVESEHRRIDGQAGKRAVDHVPGDALGLGIPRYGGEKPVEITAALRCVRRHRKQRHDDSKTNSLAMDRPALPGAISTRRLPGAIHQSAGTPIFLRMACYSKRSNAADKTSRCFTLVADLALCPTVSKEKDDY